MSDKIALFQVGKTTVVAGLIWRPLGKDPRGEVSANARIIGTRYGLLLQGIDNVMLCGFLPPTANIKARSAVSGAVWIAAAAEGPTIYIRNMPGGEFWVVAAEPGRLEPRSDQILSEDNAKQLIDQLLAEHSAELSGKPYRVIIDGDRAPLSAMLERIMVEHIEFASLVAGSPIGKAERVVQLVGIKPGQVLAVAAIIPILAIAWYGYHLLQVHREEVAFEAQRAALERQRLIAVQLQNEDQLRMAQAVVDAMRQDTATPSPQQVLEHCLGTVRGLSNNLGGWRLSNVKCDANGGGAMLQYRLDRIDSGGIGTNGSLIYAVQKHFGLTPSIQFASGQATLHVPNDPVPPRQALAPVQAPRYADVLNQFVTYFQLLGQAYQNLNYTLDPPSPRSVTYVDPKLEKSNSPNKMKSVPPDRSYELGNLTMQGDALWLLDEIKMPWRFVSITTIELTPSGQDPEAYKWRITGTYVSSRS